MKTRILYLAAMTLLAVPAAAQETYQSTKMVDNDLNGTARYVGMGGAMEALGADISTISTNPAGIGLFRSGQVSLSGGLVMQTDADKKIEFDNTGIPFDGDKTNASFDQIGIVWAHRLGQKSFLNLAFNYHKSRNFDQILNAANYLNGTSQSKLTAVKYSEASYLYNKYGKTSADAIWSSVDNNYQALLDNVNPTDGSNPYLDYVNGKSFLFGQYQKGYIGEYDFNVSGNINDRVYLGLTFGIHDVNYRSNSFYAENGENAFTQSFETLKIDGSGVDMKLGAIWRPFESSPFRIGAYISTPVFYDLDVRAQSDISMKSDVKSESVDHASPSDYSFKLSTPWKFGLSLGHTINNKVALGATYEYSNYGSIDNRIETGDWYDGWDYYESSESDDAMNDHTKQTLKGVSTVKLGVEYRPVAALALRIGYNYVSPIFEKNGFRDGSIESQGSHFATSTDYTNWKSTNRLTLGAGYSWKKCYLDLAWQYSATDGDFYPFGNEYLATTYKTDVTPQATKVKNYRHQLLLTLGYKF